MKSLKVLAILAILVTVCFGDGKKLSEMTFDEKVEHFYTKYKFEWDHIIPEKNKLKIQNSYIKGSTRERGYLAASVDFLESRGGMERYMVAIHTNKRGKITSIDCGRYGINTATLADIMDRDWSITKSVDYCFALKHDDDLAYNVMMKVFDIAEDKIVKLGYTGRERFRRMANYYVSGKVKTYVGNRYIQVVALTKLFRDEF